MDAVAPLAERTQCRLEVPQKAEVADGEENTQVQSSGLSPTVQVLQGLRNGRDLDRSGRVQTIGSRRRGPLPVKGAQIALMRGLNRGGFVPDGSAQWREF